MTKCLTTHTHTHTVHSTHIHAHMTTGTQQCAHGYDDEGFRVPHLVVLNERRSDSGCPVKMRYTQSALLNIGSCGERCVATVARLHGCSRKLVRWSRQALAHTLMQIQTFYLGMICLSALMSSLVTDLCHQFSRRTTHDSRPL